MLFSGLTFILVFLPVAVIATGFFNMKIQNILLLVLSLLFYSWGQPGHILIMLFSIVLNWAMGLLIHNGAHKPKIKKTALIIAVVLNLGLLFYYKYFGFAAGVICRFLPININIEYIALPVGISFYTFKSITYIVDLYRGMVPVQKNIGKLALYISFFPQLMAGPIVRYKDMARQLDSRVRTREKTAYGLKRFVYGLAKKVLLSNYFGLITDTVFGLNITNISTSLAWLGALLYSLQIYYDFSGYSDMAIGVGSVLGFETGENFNYPFISHSVQEFWRRWHISLSTWFREYLYIPLGGNRRGKLRTYINLFTVFLATGIWHGASLQFVAWGMAHGFFMVVERIWLGKYLKQPKFALIGRVYTLLEVLTTFVIFRAPGLRYGLSFIKAMFIPTNGGGIYPATQFIDGKVLLFVIIGVALSGFLQEKLPRLKNYVFSKNVGSMELIYLPILYFLCIVSMVSSTYNPFIYFNF